MTTSRPQEVAFFRGRNVTITGDARAFPILVNTTDGELDPETFDVFFDWRNQWINYAAANGLQIVQISVTNNMTPPNAMMRKHIGEKCKDDGKLAGLGVTCAVVPSALLRGVVTALTWVGMGSAGVKTVASLSEAGEVAARFFSSAGLESPRFDGASYVTPTE